MASTVARWARLSWLATPFSTSRYFLPNICLSLHTHTLLPSLRLPHAPLNISLVLSLCRLSTTGVVLSFTLMRIDTTRVILIDKDSWNHYNYLNVRSTPINIFNILYLITSTIKKNYNDPDVHSLKHFVEKVCSSEFTYACQHQQKPSKGSDQRRRQHRF